jgi:hypothetical protein
MEGYGLYWLALESIARNVEKHNLTFELEHDAETIAYETRLHIDHVQSVMKYMVDLELFEDDRGVITCLKMANRADEYTQKALRSRQNPDSVGTKSPLIEENRTEENRKEDKPQKRKRFVPPTIEECIEHSNNKDESEKFINYYESNGWKVGKNKMVNWKSALTGWIKRGSEFTGNSNNKPSIGSTRGRI